MEEDQNGTLPKWRTTKIENNQNGRQQKCKTTKMEDDLAQTKKQPHIIIKTKKFNTGYGFKFALREYAPFATFFI